VTLYVCLGSIPEVVIVRASCEDRKVVRVYSVRDYHGMYPCIVLQRSMAAWHTSKTVRKIHPLHCQKCSTNQQGCHHVQAVSAAYNIPLTDDATEPLQQRTLPGHSKSTQASISISKLPIPVPPFCRLVTDVLDYPDSVTDTGTRAQNMGLNKQWPNQLQPPTRDESNAYCPTCYVMEDIREDQDRGKQEQARQKLILQVR
jgi:hypothetical protein